jgi:serine/threonine-protein kinase
MAEVFRAHDSRAGRTPHTVVIKRMLPWLAGQPEARAMFKEEARLGAFVNHPNVVRVLGSGDEGDQPYLVLEYVPGLDLSLLTRWLTLHGRTLGVELSIYVIRELLAGLHAVHEARDPDQRPLGLVHRDISPSNVLLSTQGEVKLSDFGIAQARLRETLPQASLGAYARGKLGYLAPEQVRGLAADRRADVFAAAVIAAELLMGRPLFSGGSELAVLLAIRDAQVRPFVEHARTLPRGLGIAILAALARSPDDRTPTAEAFRAELEPFEGRDRSALRAHLAALVAEAHASRVPSGALPAARTPVITGDSGRTPVARVPDDDQETPTLDAPDLVYYVRTSQGQTVGPLSYAQVVEGIATSRFGLTDAFAVRDGPFRPLPEHPDLFRHVPASSLSDRTARRDTPGEPQHDWSLDHGAILQVLGHVVLARETGLLLCEHAGVRKEVYLTGGHPEFVTSNLASDLLGEFLVSRGVISREELDMALAVMPRFDGRLGDTLTALGLVQPVQLVRQIAAQVQEKLLDLFTWNAGRATFWRGAAPPQSGFRLGLDPWQILIDGVGRRLATGCGDPLAGRNMSRIVAAQPPPAGLDQARLPPSLRRVLAAASGPPIRVADLAALAEDAERDPHAGRREIIVLLAIGALAWA